MKILIGGSPSKFFHLREFGDELRKFGVEYELVIDTDVYVGFPSRKIANWFQSKEKFRKLINEYKPDAIFVDRQANFGLESLKTKIPLLVHLRGDYWSEIKWAQETLYKDPIKRFVLWYKNRIAGKCFAGAKGIFPICNYLKKIVDCHYPEKSFVLYQGISPSHWHSQEGMKLKHPCVGLLQDANIWGKTKEMYILKKVLKAMPDVSFYWVGNGPYKDKILDELKKFENFKWLGRLAYPDKVREYLSEIDVYGLVSGIDMSPLTLQEAQLMQKPVVATNVGGIPELMQDKVTGFIVKKGDAEQWIESLTLLINDEKKSKHMGKEGRKFIEENFNWSKIAGDFLRSTKSLIN